MKPLELFLLAVGLSMDAFAVAVCAGLTMPRATLKKALTVGLYFGVFQAVMPLIGYAVATWFADRIIAYDHWIAFGLLCFLGGRMIAERFGDRDCSGSGSGPCGTCSSGGRPGETSLKPAKMLPLALATSIDALAVGVSFAFLQTSIVPAVLIIGLTTFALSMLGVKIGNAFGTRFRPAAELAGGVILILIGLKILLEHLGVIGF